MPEQVLKKLREIKKPHPIAFLLAELAVIGFLLLVNTQPQKPGTTLLFFLAMTLCVALFAVHDFRESKYEICGYEIGTVEKKTHTERRNGQGKTHFYFLTVRTETGSAQYSCSKPEFKRNQENCKAYVVTIVNSYSGREQAVIVPE